MNLTFWKKRDEPGEGARTTAQSAETGLAGESEASSAPGPAVAPRSAPGAAEATAVTWDSGLSGDARVRIEAGVIEALSGVFDPEIPVNIYELGLIYDIEITPQSDVVIEMTLTSPACPVAGSLPGEVETVVSAVEGVRAVDVHLVWDPPWTPDRMSEAAKLELGFM